MNRPEEASIAMGQSYEVEARMVAPGESEATAEGKAASVRFDSSAEGDPSLFGPAELLAAAFAACLLKNVERFAGLLPFRYRGAAVTVTADRKETPPRFSRIRYVLRLDTDEPQERVDLLHRNLISHGTVFNTLARTCDVEGEVVVEQVARVGP
jgi:uncharacterized OsmC-like protein